MVKLVLLFGAMVGVAISLALPAPAGRPAPLAFLEPGANAR
jgi:hypothetical protein